MVDDWKLITQNMMTLVDYPCGVVAGDILQLRATLTYRSYDETPTGEVRPAGDQAIVLTGSPDEPDVVWIRWKDGERQTWGDTIFEDFERIGSVA